MARRTVYGNDWSSNGWPMVDEGSCTWVIVPGTNPPVSLQIQNGQPLQILRAFAADFNAEVEPLRDADSASWTAGNSVGDSNHLSGTAMDLNWDSHPFQVADAGFNQAKLAKVRELLNWYEGIVFWGNDWTSPKDAMHFQLASLANGGNINTYGNPFVDDFISRKIGPDGSSARRGAIPQQPQPSPAPDARAAAITALYDAVPVIDEDRAAQLIDPLMAGLKLAECNTVNRIAMALAQWGHESDGFNTTEEYAKNGRYAPYIGRTWIQITWQANYAAFGRWAAQEGLIDDPNYFVDNPVALADLKWAGIGPAWFWTVARPTINSLCDNRDIVAVTQLINGGQNGITDRRNRYQQALSVGDRLLTLIASEPEEGPLMALTDDEQTELLTKVRYIFDQLGPKHPDWSADSSMGVSINGDELTLRDGLAAMVRKVDSPEVAIVTFQTEKP
ncbi:M15 family metallopeptidase [Mycobacterium sp. 23]|uniref:M15 family metallopeptidase n=1 Tax=Mycobacterium sp. 23 TaxID=3400424 RepID=UPI003AAD321D